MSRKLNLSLKSLTKYNKHHRNDNVFVKVDKVPSVIFLLEDSKNACSTITTSSKNSDKSSLQSIHLANFNINCCKTSDHTIQKVYYGVNSKHKVSSSVDQIGPFDAQRTMNRKKRRGNAVRKMNRISEQRKYLSDHKTTNKLKNTGTYCINKKTARVGALNKLNPVIEFGKVEMEGPHFPVKLYGNEVCRKTKVFNHFECLDSPMTGIYHKVYCVKSNQFDANVHDSHFKSSQNCDHQIYKNVLQKRFLNKTEFYPYSTTPSIYYMTNFKYSNKSVANITDEFYSCTRISDNNAMKFSDDNKIINPCYSKTKQYAFSDASIKSTTDGNDKPKSPIKIYRKTSKCATRDCKEAINNTEVLVSNHSEIGLKNDKRSEYFTTKFSTQINEHRKPLLPTMEINLGKMKTNRRKHYKYLKADSSRHYDSTSIEQLNIIYSDYPELEKNSSGINLHQPCSNLKTRCMGVGTSSFVKVSKNYITYPKKTNTKLKQGKLYNDQRVDKNVKKNPESTIEYTDCMPSEPKRRHRSRLNSKAELFEKCETPSQQNPSEDTSTSFGYFDIKKSSKVKLKVIYALNRHKKGVEGIANSLKNFFKGALRCKSDDTYIEPDENNANRSQILYVASSSSLHKKAFGIQRSSSNHYCYFEEIQPQKSKYTKEVGTNVFIATIPQKREYNSNYYYNKLGDNTYNMKPDLTRPKLHKPVEIQPSTEISNLENTIFGGVFLNNNEGRWAKYKICQNKKTEKSSRTSRSSSFTHKFKRYQWKSFHRHVRKSTANRQNKNSITSNVNKISASILSNLYPRVPYVRSAEIRRRCDNFYIFKACPRSTRQCRTLRFGSPRTKPEPEEWIVHPIQLKVNNRIKKLALTEKNTFTPQTRKLQTCKYFQQNKPVSELSTFIKDNVNNQCTEPIESSTSSFEKCIIEYVNSFHNMVHKIKETGLLSMGNINKKIVSKDINKMPKDSWLTKLSFSSYKKTNKTIRSSKRTIWRNKVQKVKSNDLLHFSDNQEEKIFLTNNIVLESEMNRKNKNAKQIFPKSNIVNFHLKKINNRSDIEIVRAKTPVYSYRNKKDESGNNCTKQKYMKVDTISTKTYIPKIDDKNIQNNVCRDEETRGQNANGKTNKITKKKNTSAGSNRFTFNKFCRIGHKFTGVKTILKTQNTKNIENKIAKANTAVGDSDEKVKNHKLSSQRKTGKLPNNNEIKLQNKLQETQMIIEHLKDDMHFNEKYISPIDKHGSDLNVFDKTKDNQKKDVCNTETRGNSVSRVQNPQESFTMSQYYVGSDKRSSLTNSCKAKRTFYLKPVFIVTKRNTRNLIGHLVLVEYTKPKRPLFCRDRLPVKIKYTEK